ncbi:hypothetical protein DRP05_13740 [Archaeoglobales archaeon]|nr:MAG: hypothetical protein DRP05_13740 [Archaeoglobales archaeon]
MLPSDIKKQIFQSLPKSVVIGSTEFQAWIDYADRINVSEKLKDPDYHIVVTLRYFADKRDEKHSPINQLFKKEIVDPDIKYTRGERAVITLSINVHAKGDSNIPAADIVDAYMDQLLVWYLKDLPGIDNIEIAGRSEINDLSYLEDGLTRRQLDILIRYMIQYQETVITIETVEHTTDVQS